MRNWFGILFVVFMLGAVMLVLRWAIRRYAFHPEWGRKLLHICMGLTSLSLPYLFHDTWPVMLLVALTVPSLWSLRHFKQLKTNFGGVLHNVNRDGSLGELCFPVGVAGAFWLSNGSTIHFIIPILLLTFSDSIAALVGVHYAKTRYPTLDGSKSVEGSLAFFVTTFLCSVFAMRLGLPHLLLLETLLIATTLSLSMMLVEALSAFGSDNFWIPVGGFVFFDFLLRLSTANLFWVALLTMPLSLAGFAGFGGRVLGWQDFTQAVVRHSISLLRWVLLFLRNCLTILTFHQMKKL
jgi:phytol kinase